jgi:hypothetical protein
LCYKQRHLMSPGAHVTRYQGAIDCDVHPKVPSPEELLPFMDEQWAGTVRLRGIDTWATIGYPANAPHTVREDWRKATPRADSSPAGLAAALLDPHKFAHAICNQLFPISAFRDPTLAAVFSRAVNDWLAATWLAKDARLRGAAVVPIQASDLAVEEIERLAGDKRFVQILLYGRWASSRLANASTGRFTPPARSTDSPSAFTPDRAIIMPSPALAGRVHGSRTMPPSRRAFTPNLAV